MTVIIGLVSEVPRLNVGLHLSEPTSLLFEVDIQVCGRTGTSTPQDIGYKVVKIPVLWISSVRLGF